MRGTVDGEWNLGNRLVPMPQLPAPEVDRDDDDDEIGGGSADDPTSLSTEEYVENYSSATSSTSSDASPAILDVAAGHSHLIAVSALDSDKNEIIAIFKMKLYLPPVEWINE